MIHVDDAFGRDGAEGYKEGVRVTGISSVYEGSFAADKPDFAKHVNALLAARTMTGRDGHTLHALPVDRTLELVDAAGRLAR